MFFYFGFLERFLLASPPYLLFLGVLLSVFFINSDFKNKQLWIFDIILIFLFYIFVFIFFYINEIDFIAGFPIKKVSIFLILLILNIIMLEKPNNEYDVLINFIFLLSAIAIIFFEKIFIIFSGLIIMNLLFYYRATDEKINIRHSIIYILILIFLLGICITFTKNKNINKFCLTGLLISIFGFSIFKTEVIDKLKTNYLFFFSVLILYFILFYKILVEYKEFLAWQPVLLILIILFIINSFYLLTEEKYKKFICYDFINNIFILFLFLITSEFKFRSFIISLIFLYFLILTSKEFIKEKNNNNLSVTFIKYNIHRVKERIPMSLNLLFSLLFNIYIIIEQAFLINENHFIKMSMFFILLVFFVNFLDKIFIFFSFVKKIKFHLIFSREFIKNFILIFLFLSFYCILVFNLKKLNTW